MKPTVGDEVRCSNCDHSYRLPPMPLDDLYIPQCPECNDVTDGYEEVLREQEHLNSVREYNKELDEKLRDVREQFARDDHEIPLASSKHALVNVRDRLRELTQEIEDVIQGEFETKSPHESDTEPPDNLDDIF